MADLRESMGRIAEQMGELPGEDFWARINELVRNGGLPLGPAAPPRPRGTPPPGPPLEIYVLADRVVVAATLPGLLATEHVTVSLAGPQELVIEAFIPPRALDGMWLQRERFSGYCTRTVTLPVSVQPGGAAATYNDGVLELHLPRLSPGQGNPGVAVLQVP